MLVSSLLAHLNMSKPISMDLSTKHSCNMMRSESSRDPIDLDETESPEGFVEGNVDAENVVEPQGDSKQVENQRKHKKKRKPRMGYWADFSEYEDEQKRRRARCKFCKKTYACDTDKNGTKNVKNHAASCKENPANQGKGNQAQLVFDDSMPKVRNWVYNAQDVRQAVTEMIIKDEMPFRAVEKEGLKHAFHVACPAFKMPSRTTTARDVLVLFKKEKEKLKEFLRVSCQRVCLTTDTWTSIQTENYMCVTAHFIDDDWMLQKRILNFCPIYSHKGEAIGRALEDCSGYWGLCDKLLTVTVDNAPANDVACSYLREMTKELGCIGQGKYLHMRCMAHIINLFVQDGLNVCVKSVEKVRAIVKYVRSSPSRLHAFRQQVDKCKISCKAILILDVPTRWNSTYTMLNIALKYKSAIVRMNVPVMKEEKLSPLSVDEWKQVEDLCDFLREFFHLTNRVSGSLYVTSNYMIYHILAVVNALNKLILSVDSTLQSVAIQMKKKCDKYWGSLGKMNMLMFVDAILDPSLKFGGVKVALSGIFGQADLDENEKIVKDFAYDLFDQYRNTYAPLRSVSEGSISRPSVVEEEDENIAWITTLTEQVTRETSNLQGNSRSEFDSYLLEVKGQHEEKDVLKWWKLNGPRYPILKHMARDVLAILISTVASESAFSTGGRTLDQYRASLLPSTVQALICTQDWLRTRSKKSKCEEDDTIEEVEIIQEDMENNCPDDLLDGVFFVGS